MLETDLKDEKLKRLVRAAKNAPEMENEVLFCLTQSGNEEEFAEKWYWHLRNHVNRVIGFYNELAPRTKHMTVIVDHNPL